MDNLYLKFKELEKADLHLHLNGLFVTDIIKLILIEEETPIPKGFNIDSDLNVMNPKHSLLNYLTPWNVLRLIPKTINNLSRLIASGFDVLAADNVKFVEIRSSIVYLSLLQNNTLENTLEILLHEIKTAAIVRNIDYRLIFTISRDDYGMVFLNSLIQAYDAIGRPNEIVGLDLAGNEDYPVTKNLGKTFKLMKDKYGFRITVHAGETGNINNIHEAINVFGATRIGHGTALGQCERTMDLLAKKDICIEVCPISNRRTGAVKSQESHPVKSFIKYGVPFVLCSDNPSIHCATLTDDYWAFYKETKRLDILENMFLTQTKYSFK